jgi:hypothetical protein
VPVKEAIRGVVINEGVISQPLHGPALGPGVPEGVPGGQQVGMLFVELVFEPAEGSLALDSPCQPAPGALIGDSVGEVGHVLIPDPGRQRLDDDQVQLIEVDRRLPVNAGVSRPERDLDRVRVDQLPVLVIGRAASR